MSILISVTLALTVFVLLAWRVVVLDNRWTKACHTAGMSSGEPVKDVLNEIARLKRAEWAAYRLYYTAHWTADRECGAERLWTELRDAAGWSPENRPKPMDS